ncbi:MAG: FAD-dependent oxidoreductase, partial [Deltaproteobacteria bacterium]|nr:FAD-dependent oxidoreductase [Deltaproteobacteria bacterium]
MEKCIACGLCYEKCPAKISDEYNEGLSKRKAIYVPYPQAVPLKYVIDKDRCIYFKKGKCKACEKFCPTGAIKFDETEENITLKVGSVILTSGMKAFDPSKLDNYQHSSFPNVITSLEFERILSAGGPTTGHVTRPSDGEEPKKIAWLQCVGSRDLNRCDNQYCSSVCCMYAIKEAVIAREHIGDGFESTVFFMDMRTHGKDFEKFYDRAKDEGVRFIRSRVHTITEADETGTLNLKYFTEAGETVEEKFDMAVLSVGMEPADSTEEIAKTMGIELNEHRFVKTENISPVLTTRPGIYVAGVIQGCKDIPQSVMEASAAACSAGISLASARGTLVQKKTFPAETEVTSQTPRIGVFVCNCGTNIGGFADVPAIAEYAKSLPNVAYVEENLFTCSQDTQDKMVEVIREHNLNRIVVAACTPRTHEPLFQETVRNASLNPYLFEMANIRNQCTWVHSNDKKIATEKSKDLVRMAISRASLLDPISELTVDIQKSALVIGGGVAGMNAALSLANQGYPATIVEKSSELGGAAKDLHQTWSGQNIPQYLDELVKTVQKHSAIEVMLDSEISNSSGFVGNFETQVSNHSSSTTVQHGVTIVATGGQATDTNEYLYGKNPNVTRWHDLENNPEKLKNATSVVFI